MIRIVLRKSQGKLFHVAGHTAQNPGGGGSHFVHAHESHRAGKHEEAAHAAALHDPHGLPPRTGPRPTTNVPMSPAAEARMRSDPNRVARDRWIVQDLSPGGAGGWTVVTPEGHQSTSFKSSTEAAAYARGEEPPTPPSASLIIDPADIRAALKKVGLSASRGGAEGYSMSKLEAKRYAIRFDDVSREESQEWGGPKPKIEKAMQDAADALHAAGFRAHFYDYGHGLHVVRPTPKTAEATAQRSALPWPKHDTDWHAMGHEHFGTKPNPEREDEEHGPFHSHWELMGFRTGYADVRSGSVGVRKVKPGGDFHDGYHAGVTYAQKKTGEKMNKSTPRRLVVRLSALPPELVEDDGYGNLRLRKGGEGSRGGHVVGHTKSGKPVYAPHYSKTREGQTATLHPQSKGGGNKGWTAQDHDDAAGFHRKESAEHNEKFKSSKDWYHRAMSDAHYGAYKNHMAAARSARDAGEASLRKSAIPGIHSAVRARDVAAVAGAAEPVTELPGSKMQDGAGRVLRGRFSCGRYQFEFQKAASGLSVVSASGGKLPMSFHMVVRGYDTARRDAPDWVREFEAGRVPMEGVFKKTGDSGRPLTLRKAAGSTIPAVVR